MKRKYQTLESESRDLTDLVHMLMDRPRQESLLILDHMRRTRDTSSTLAFVREGDLLTWGLTTTSETDPNQSNSAIVSERESIRDMTDGVDNTTLQAVDGIRDESVGSAASNSPKRRLAISDLVNRDVT